MPTIAPLTMMPAMNRFQGAAKALANQPAFGKVPPASVAIGQIRSNWEYGVMINAGVLRIIVRDMDKGLDALGTIPDGLTDAFGSAPKAVDALRTFVARQRGFMMINSPAQSTLTLADGKVSVQLLNTGDTDPDTLAYAIKTPKGNYALTIAKAVNDDNIDGVYAKFRNHVMADASQVQNVPRFYAAHPEQGWILTELMEVNNLPKDWRSRGTQTFSQFLADNSLVHVSPTDKNVVGPYVVDLGHIIPREHYDREVAATLGPADKHMQAFKAIEANLI